MTHLTVGISRGLINAQPQPDGRKLDEGEEVGSPFLISPGNSTAVPDPVKEPLDHISVAIEVPAEAYGITPVATWWDVRPAST